MFDCKRTKSALCARVATVLWAAAGTDLALAAPTLESIAVTPTAASISVGQTQSFVATGTFNNSSAQTLGPAIGDIAPGASDSCALLTSGGVECWGLNSDGELGDGDTTDSLIARPVKGITTAVAVAHGGLHSCALLASGALRCWGRNDRGQLGNGTTKTVTTPVAVSGISHACK